MYTYLYICIYINIYVLTHTPQDLDFTGFREAKNQMETIRVKSEPHRERETKRARERERERNRERERERERQKMLSFVENLAFWLHVP